jgi:hypothetical protein
VENLVVNGCSFTQGTTWASFLNKKTNPKNYYNLAQGGAGNKYICDSTIAFLESNNFVPQETLVLIMWSGIGRKDLHISGEWYYCLKDEYCYLCEKNNESYYLHSGGLTNSWLKNNFTKKVFEFLYKISDPLSICVENLLFFIQLESYLKCKNYKFAFTNYYNTWDPTVESTMGGDYCIANFCTLASTPLYDNFNFHHWIFLDENKMCLGDFASTINEIDQSGHPTLLAHRQFSEFFSEKITNYTH